MGDPAAIPPARWHLCRSRGVERADRRPRHAGDRHAQRVRSGDGDVRRRDRSRIRASDSSRISPPAQLDPPSIARSRCSAPAASAARRQAPTCSRRNWRGLSPQGRHPEISGRDAARREPLARRMLRFRRARRARSWSTRARQQKESSLPMGDAKTSETSRLEGGASTRWKARLDVSRRHHENAELDYHGAVEADRRPDAPVGRARRAAAGSRNQCAGAGQ